MKQLKVKLVDYLKPKSRICAYFLVLHRLEYFSQNILGTIIHLTKQIKEMKQFVEMTTLCCWYFEK